MTTSRTHPWITFRVSLRELTWRDWLLLGEAQSKCRHLASVPLLPEVEQTLHEVYLARGALATTAIEGNTLTEEEVSKLLAGALQLPPSRAYLGQEVGNVVTAYNELLDRLVAGELGPVSVADIQLYNRQILKDLPRAEGAAPGHIRTHNVEVGRYRGAPAAECGALLERLVRWLQDESLRAEEENRIVFGILRAILAHLYLAWIHPFSDGNGRTARMVEAHLLLESGVPSAAAQLLSNHYNRTRTEYYRQLDAASRSGGDVFPFVRYALQGFIDGLREQIEYVTAQQLSVHWENYVYDRFRELERDSDRRRRMLVLELSGTLAPVPIESLRRLSPRIAEVYAPLTDRTLQRDLRALEEMRLLVREGSSVRINVDLLLARRPFARA